MRSFKLILLSLCAACFCVQFSKAQTTIFSEDCGTTAPTVSPRPSPDAYTGWKNYNTGAVHFSGNADVRATTYDNSHIWFGAGAVRTFTISGINTQGYQDIKLSFRAVTGSATTINVNSYLTVSCSDANGKTYTITLPATATTSQNSWITESDLAGIPATSSLSITFSVSASNSTGIRMDDFTLTAGNGTTGTTDNTTTGSATDSIDFKIATLNTEWLSCADNGPSDEALQLSNIITVIKAVNPDVIALQEIGTSTSYATVDTIVKKLGTDWAGKIVPWNASNCYQNQGIVYKKAKAQYVSASLMADGGSSYNWSSGRYPVLYNLNLIAGTNSYPVSFINIHAKAYSDAASYVRRQGASQGLKALLDGASYNAKRLVILGDLNDYLIGSTCTDYSDSPYKNFVDDAVNYKGLTSTMSSIDNILISNELFKAYVAGSVMRETAATQTVSNYTSTTTDHYPVSAVIRLSAKSVTDISDAKADEDMLAYINPANNFLFVKSSEQLKELRVYTLTGQKVAETVQVAKGIDMSRFTAGVYIIGVRTERGYYQQKVLKD